MFCAGMVVTMPGLAGESGAGSGDGGGRVQGGAAVGVAELVPEESALVERHAEARTESRPSSGSCRWRDRRWRSRCRRVLPGKTDWPPPTAASKLCAKAMEEQATKATKSNP